MPVESAASGVDAREPLPWRLFPLPERLVSSPLSVLCLALLVNALVQPYLGLFHDARLYAFYLNSRLEPAQGFDHDLFLVYGSQDRFSAFSLIMFPLVKLLGLETGLFIVYLLSKALLSWGFQRLVRALTRNDMLTAVIVLFVAVSPIPFGGNGVFSVNEAFLTPRLGAAALVLLALERMLARKVLLPSGLLLGALALHPLMGVGGVLTFVLWWLFGRLKLWQLALLFVLVSAASVGVLAYEPFGNRVFGHMDDTWRAINLQICFFVKPSEWLLEDWTRMAWDCVILVVGAFTFARHCGRFLWAVLAAGLIGLVWSVVGVETNYLLLIQTSPYRTLWVLEALAIPLGLMAVSHLWQRNTAWARSGSLALLLAVSDEWRFTELSLVFLLLLTASFVVFVIWQRGLRQMPAEPQWLWLAAWQTFLIACGLYVLYAGLVLWFTFAVPPASAVSLDPVNLAHCLTSVTARLVCVIAACYGADRLSALLGSSRRFQVSALTTAVVYLAVGTYLLGAPWYRSRFEPAERHTQFIGAFLKEHSGASGQAPCVYWNTDIDRIWFGLRANSYVTIYQLAGCAFNRETACEGKRRVHLVASFEAAEDRQAPKQLPPRWRQFFADFRDCPIDAEPPTRDDLLRLAQEETLDYAVLSIPFDDLYCATDGVYYIYDCRRLRSIAASHSRRQVSVPE